MAIECLTRTPKEAEKASVAAASVARDGLRASGRIQTLRSSGRTSGSLERERSVRVATAASRDGDCLLSPDSDAEAALEVVKPRALLGPRGAGFEAAYTIVSQFRHLAQTAFVPLSSSVSVSRDVNDGYRTVIALSDDSRASQAFSWPLLGSVSPSSMDKRMLRHGQVHSVTLCESEAWNFVVEEEARCDILRQSRAKRVPMQQ